VAGIAAYFNRCCVHNGFCQRIIPVTIATRARALRENLDAKCTVRLPQQTRQLFAQLVVVEGHDCFASVCRRYIALGLRADGVDPAALGLLDPV